MINLIGMPNEELINWCLSKGEKGFRAKQLLSWIHKKNIIDFNSMSDLSKNFRDLLSQEASVFLPKIENSYQSLDGSKKWLLNLGAGNVVETVLIPDKDRNTLCISSQAGCAVDCSFCSTGSQGFSRNLTSDEIIAQLWIAKNSTKGRISNVVMMGMGEPLLNFNNLIRALMIMTDDDAYGLSKRKITVSTSGVVPMINKLADNSPVGLAVSLHAGNDELRSKLVPMNKKYPINLLLDACKDYLLRTSTGFITFEITMLKGVNDKLSHAREIVDKIRKKNINCKFNLIPFNSFPHSGFECSSPKTIEKYSKFIQAEGYIATSRKTRGDDISAACGQLAGEIVDRTKIKERKAFFFRGVSR